MAGGLLGDCFAAPQVVAPLSGGCHGKSLVRIRGEVLQS